VLRADTDQSVIELVAAGLGGAIVPELAAHTALDRVHARPLEPSIDLPPRVTAFGWERARRLLPDEIALMDDVTTAVSSSTSVLLARSAA
jgi:DNA-binding transcriptional LysR family regulator